METIVKNAWYPLPPVELSSPIFALAAGPDGVWASGTGGVAWYAEHKQDDMSAQGSEEHSHVAALVTNGWESRISALQLSSVTTVMYRDDLLLVGGLEGIAYSEDGGLHWERAKLEVKVASITALAPSPHFAEDGTVVAATLVNGILRTTDSGQTWVSASSGLESQEMTSLAWMFGSTLLATTPDSIYRSSDAGCTWERVYKNEDLSIDAVAYLSETEVLATLEDGGLLRSKDGGAHWSFDGSALRDVHILSVLVEPAQEADGRTKTIFLGTLEQGLLRSTDGGTVWETVYQNTVISLASEGNRLYAGTESGVSRSDDNGRTWHALSRPPVHDLARLLIHEDQPLLIGPYAGLVRYTGSDWEVLPELPAALTATTIAPDGSLLVSSSEGLVRLSSDEEYEQQVLLEGQDGQVSFMTFRRNDASWQAWAASGDGTRLLRSDDEGRTWQSLHDLFGGLPLVALQVIPDRIVAATYDPPQRRVCVWSSTDDGETWERGIQAETAWPVVATSDDPPLITMSYLMLIHNDAGEWHEVRVCNDGGMIRRVVGARQNRNNEHVTPVENEGAQSEASHTGSAMILFALTTTGILRSDDWGETWEEDNEGLPVEQVVDIAATSTDLYVFLAGGQVWKRAHA